MLSTLLFLSTLLLGNSQKYYTKDSQKYYTQDSQKYYTKDALQDQITTLPGLNMELKFNQFSGYLNLNGTKKNIHYWLVESELNSNTAPLVFWTNGGPGCSGLIGFMTEQGPFRPTKDGNMVLE